jgi:outer membrane biosynthesis protein TonB
MTLVMVDVPSSSEASVDENIISAGTAESDLLIQVASSDPAPLLTPDQFETEEVDEEAAHTAGDPAVQSKLFGSYTSQIDARIQRAWRKPRNAILVPAKEGKTGVRTKTEFSCQARISQDINGNVTEVELLQCDDDSAWEISLVNAIQRASPLPSPPNPTVFTNVLTLSFEARTYMPGYREDDYEPRAVEVARATFN